MRIAVVGSGIAGLTAAWRLNGRAEVTLFEAADYAGGHSNTVEVEVDGVGAAVDTGFLVHNDRTYPQLIRLFETLGVATHPSEMSLSIRDEASGLEWNGSRPAALLANPGNFLRRDFWRMLRDILRFNRSAQRLLAETEGSGLSLGQLLDRHGFGDAFRDGYLLPMGGAIWSTPARDMLDFPAHTFLRFCHNHGLLQLTDRPRWRTVQGGSREYVRRMVAALPDVRLSTPVRRTRRLHNGVELFSGDSDRPEYFDAVVLACHTDQSLALLADASADERRLLGAIRYAPNRAVLHTDTRFLPSNPALWAAWNYHAGDGGQIGVTYLLNRLQPLPFERPLMVTLNPERAPEKGLVLREFSYQHPQFDAAAIAAQQELPAIQGLRHTWFCGAWARYGFHEDGHVAGLQVADDLLRRIGERGL